MNGDCVFMMAGVDDANCVDDVGGDDNVCVYGVVDV